MDRGIDPIQLRPEATGDLQATQESAAPVVIVGGGAGGLELACKLGRKLGAQRVTLVDSRLYHVWKPSLHEVAAGTLDIHQEGLSYQMLAFDNDFTFVYGAMTGLDPAQRCLTVAPIAAPDGEVLIPERRLAYGTLCIAVGSVSNYFGIDGAQQYTISLNATEDAERFRLRMLRLLVQAEQAKEHRTLGDEVVEIVIIGGGATGVELAAELRSASGAYTHYGFHALNPSRDVRITLIEGADRILAPLPERVSKAAAKLLDERHVRVVTHCRVAKIEPDAVVDTNGNRYPSDLCVWAAGIKAPELLGRLGLPTTKSGQLEVTDHLTVKDHPDIFAFGDCAACTDRAGKPVPPRAQAAHQQADYLLHVLLARALGQPLPQQGYLYRDYGSLVSVGHDTTVGSLMGSLRGIKFFVHGFVARMMYASLHLMHHRAVLGTIRTALLAIARFLIKRSTALVKLH